LWGTAVNIATIVTPVVGAVVLVLFGFGASFLVACLLLLLSAAVMFLRPDFSFRYIALGRNFRKENLPYLSVYFGAGALYIAFTLWPLIIFLYYPEYMAIGWTFAFFEAVQLAINLGTGYFIDTKGPVMLLRIAAVFGAAAMLLSAAILPAVFTIALLFGIYLISFSNAEFVLSCRAARKQEFSFMAFREVGLIFGSTFVLLAFLVTLNPAAVFVAAAIAALPALFARFRMK
jgi:hypothetical protein